MSDWRPKQGPASFRGVQFFVESGEHGGGRQIVKHDFPNSEAGTTTEDLGKKGESFSVEGYVLGTEYEAARDALIDALNTPGPGELVHPYFGTRNVAAETFRVRQTRARGGMASFTIEFRETTTPANPAVTVAAVPVALSRASALELVAGTSLVSVHSALPAGNLFALLPSPELGVFNDALGALQSAIDSLPVAPELRAQFGRLMSNLSGGAFASAAEQLVDKLGGLFGVLYDAVQTSPSPIDPVALFLRIFDLEPTNRPVGTSPARVQEQRDFDALATFTARLALTYASRALVERSFATFDEAVASRDSVCAALDEHVDEVVDDAFSTVSDLRASLVEAVPGADSDLPQLQRFTPPATLPSLVIAHQLYGDLDHESDLVLRNRLRHPGFVVGGRELEVLSDD